jgi:gliding motility-associated-like protein
MRFAFLFLLVICAISSSFATHNRAGEITYRHLGGLEYEATITTYTKADSPADRPNLEINWGDGVLDTIPRVNGQGETVALNIKRNIYVGRHTYPAASIYTLSFEDPNRNGGVVNIPNSINIPFYVSTLLVINPFLGVNNSVQLLNAPIDEACAGQIFMHNPAAYDPDGDSISYRLVQCLGEGGLPIPGFNQPIATNALSLDPFTGDLVWNTPPLNGVGEYNIAFVIEEWRNGIRIGMVTRDMQINVVPCNNQPPVITALQNICIDAGTILSFPVTANDQTGPASQQVTLSASGGPFLIAPPHNAEFGATTGLSTVTQQFFWNTSCAQVRQQPYLITFKASDNGNPPLSTFETFQVRIVSPGPETLEALPEGNAIRLNWSECPCPQAIGYAVYRKNESYGFLPANCETGVPAYTGFIKVAEIEGLNTLSWLDTQPGAPGNITCYMVIALFSDGSESYASPEACSETELQAPIITHVSIDSTSIESGQVYIAWKKPPVLDTLQFPGPYQYRIERLTGNSFASVGVVEGLDNTEFTEVNQPINTSVQLNYRITLEHISMQTEIIGISEQASSVFLSGNAMDNRIELSWDESVPWQNSSYTIYRKLSGSANFDSIAVVDTSFFVNQGLANGVEYCYRIRSKGRYSGNTILDTLYNFSQEICLSAIDDIAPCTPPFEVFSSCDSLKNRINWAYADLSCALDGVKLMIYFSSSPWGSRELLAELPFSAFGEFLHERENSVAGCYFIAVSDSVQNLSYDSLAVCVDNCPEYTLPNVFTPNGDGKNDVFSPFPYRFIDKVSLQIFNRWGIEVFSTDDKDILWNGRIFNNGDFCTDGTYFYAGTVYENRLAGLVPRKIKGVIQIISSKEFSGQ